LANAGNCRDWETGVPVELDDIRDKDEDYWTRYKGTPKAFISLETATALWANRYGTYTAFRMPASIVEGAGPEQMILDAIHPRELGFEVVPVREEAEFAAGHGVDFSQLFAGLSFFLLLGAILLSVLLFLLNMEERAGQVATLRSIGIPFGTIRWILVAEGMVVAFFGALAGLLLAVLYNKLIFSALNTIWMDIVRTEMLVADIRVVTLLTGLLLSLVIAFLSVYFPLGRFLKRPAAQQTAIPVGKDRASRLSLPAGLVLMGAALLLVVLQLLGNEVHDPATFFISGGLFLLAGLLIFYGYMVRLRQGRNMAFDLPRLSMKNAIRNATRTLSILVLFAIGTFLVISTGSNRKDMFVNADDRGSGTGGFLYFAESTTPVLQNLNNPDVRYALGLGDNYRFTQMRVAEGDDASCLNLNRIMNPRILATDPGQLYDRFSFITSIDMLDSRQPWRTLEETLPGGVIPAIADETVIKWGLGLSVGDTLYYQNAAGDRLKLLLVGGLAPSIFQGNVIVSEKHFIENFPSSSGTGVFLVDGPLGDTAMISAELNRAMRDYGWTMTFTGERLAEFYSVTNTYLSIFLVMGALGLLLGTVGLSVVLFRSTLERRKELALLRSVGYSMKQIRALVFREYAGLLLVGIFIGAIAAILATLPAFLSQHTGISIRFVLLILAILLVNGLFWTRLMAGMALRRRSLSVALRNE
jgi:ABC-type antimicrobial peptide transport system permease subunit